jgi:hypothetical protein
LKHDMDLLSSQASAMATRAARSSYQPYARRPAFAYRALLSLVSDCGNRTTLVGWDVRR